jgi:hypothetical protein
MASVDVATQAFSVINCCESCRENARALMLNPFWMDRTEQQHQSINLIETNQLPLLILPATTFNFVAGATT